MLLVSVLAVSPEGKSRKAEQKISVGLFLKPMHTPQVEQYLLKTQQSFWKLLQM
jgi:hypothetical protein